MIAIREEVREIEEGEADCADDLLKRAPHTAHVIASDTWERAYSRERAAFPTEWTREHKFWPAVGRIDHVQGDRCLVCSWMPEELEARAWLGRLKAAEIGRLTIRLRTVRRAVSLLA